MYRSVLRTLTLLVVLICPILAQDSENTKNKLNVLGGLSSEFVDADLNCEDLSARLPKAVANKKIEGEELQAILERYVTRGAQTHFGIKEKVAVRVISRSSHTPAFAAKNNCDEESDYFVVFNAPVVKETYKNPESRKEWKLFFEGVIAHEEGHIVQDILQKSVDGLERLADTERELHADFLAGYSVNAFQSDTQRNWQERVERLRRTMKIFTTFFMFGDDDSKTYQTPHGSPDLRLMMVLSGYRAADTSSSLMDACERGIRALAEVRILGEYSIMKQYQYW